MLRDDNLQALIVRNWVLNTALRLGTASQYYIKFCYNFVTNIFYSSSELDYRRVLRQMIKHVSKMRTFLFNTESTHVHCVTVKTCCCGFDVFSTLYSSRSLLPVIRISLIYYDFILIIVTNRASTDYALSL